MEEGYSKLNERIIEATIAIQNFNWAVEDLIEKEVESDAEKAIQSINKFLNKTSLWDTLKMQSKWLIKLFGKFLDIVKPFLVFNPTTNT